MYGFNWFTHKENVFIYELKQPRVSTPVCKLRLADFIWWVTVHIWICVVIFMLRVVVVHRYTPCIISHITHRSWQHFKMELLWRYGRELCYTLELIQTLYAQNDKVNGVGFYNSVFPGEAKMCFGFMSFRTPSAALKLKNCHNSPNMQPIIT